MKSIVQKRTDYEYTMMRFELTPNEIEKYLSYEKNLLQLFQIRYNKYKKAKEGQLNRSELDLFRSVKVAFVQHIHYIFERSTKKFPGHFPFWFQHIDFLKENESYVHLDTLLGKVLALYPYEVDFWICSALYELQQKQNLHAARVMMQRGLRVNARNHKLWKCYFDLEMWNLLRAVERQNLLIKKPLSMADANRKKIEEQQNSGENIDSSSSAVPEFDHAAEAPLLVVFKYACRQLLGIDEEDGESEDEDGFNNNKVIEVTDLAKGGLDLKAKLTGLEVLFAMHQGSIILSPKLTKDMEEMLRLALHVDDEIEDGQKTLNEDSVTLINALMTHLVHLQVKKSLVESKVFDLFASYQLHLHEKKQHMEKSRLEMILEQENNRDNKKAGKGKKTDQSPEDNASDKELSSKIIREILVVFQKSSHYVQDLMVALPQCSTAVKDKKPSSASNKILTAAMMMDTFSSCFVNMLVETYLHTLSSSLIEIPKAEKKIPNTEEGTDEGEEQEEVPAEEDDVLPDVDTLKELVREKILSKINANVNPVEPSDDEEDESTVTLTTLIQTVIGWVKSNAGPAATVEVPPTSTIKSKKGSKKSTAVVNVPSSSSDLSKTQEALSEVVKAFEALFGSGNEGIVDDLVRGKISFLTQLEHHRITNTSLSILSDLFQVSSTATTISSTQSHLVTVAKKLNNYQEKMPLGEAVKEEVIEIVAYWSQLVLQLLVFEKVAVDAEEVVNSVRSIAPLLSLSSIGESLLRHMIANVEDETFFESVCHSIISHIRLVAPSLRMQWVMIYIENSTDDLTTLQKTYEWIMKMRSKNPQLFAGVSFEEFMTFVISAVDEVDDERSSDNNSDKKRSGANSCQIFLQKVLETAIQDCGLYGTTSFTDRLVEIYRQQGQHAKANHILFKRRRLE